MRLADWLDARDRSVTREVSERLQIHPRSLRRIARGEYSPSFELAGRISVATKGVVTVEDLLGRLPEGAEWCDDHASLKAMVAAEEAAVALPVPANSEKRPQAPATAMILMGGGAAA